MELLENPRVLKYLQERNLVKQYKKARSYFEHDQFLKIKLKKRKPLSQDIYQFRINKKYRAIGVFKEDHFEVFKIDDHQ